MAEHIRYWEHIKPNSQTRLADDVVDAILRDVFQGEKGHLREHMRGVAHKAVRGHEWPYFEECVEKAVAERLAGAPGSGSRTEYALEATRNDGKLVNFGVADATLEQLKADAKEWLGRGATVVERTVTTTYSDWKPVKEEERL